MAKKTTRKRRPITRAGIKRPDDTGETIADLRKRLETAGKPRLPTPPDAVVGLKRADMLVAFANLRDSVRANESLDVGRAGS